MALQLELEALDLSIRLGFLAIETGRKFLYGSKQYSRVDRIWGKSLARYERRRRAGF